MLFNEKHILAIGEVLWDIFPKYKRFGGAPFNFAFHIHNIGFDTTLVSGVGTDPDGKTILELLEDHRMDTSAIQVSNNYPTGKVLVEVDDRGTPEYNILTGTAYDHIQFSLLPPGKLPQADLIYFGTLIQRSKQGRETLYRILNHRSEHTRCLCDLNLRTGCYDKYTVTKSLEYSHVVKLNREELEMLKPLQGFSGSDNAFIEYLFKQYHLDILCLTEGASGSHIYTPQTHIFQESEPVTDIADTVGAGDAYTAILATGYMAGWPIEKTLRTASWFASQICQIEGAVPQENISSFYNRFKNSYLMEKEK